MSEREDENAPRGGEQDQDSFPPVSRADLTEPIGAKIGPYRLLSVLGEGGFGIVYLAEQKKPVRRQVALKVIKPGMDSKQVIARFEAEQQALALLDHPNIAHVLDSGITEKGRPYFAMEYVRGTPITEHCDRHKLTLEERLRLFVQVCEAVQHAHQKAIIHRDIKPSNILVSVQGKKGLPKIIDFGVAKALSQPLTERTLFTEKGQLIGTPEYMSPEQAEVIAQNIDTRSDIYSLGVVLYELLTGALPFDAKTLRQAAFGEIQRIIQKEDPPRPSTRISSLGEKATDVAQKRRTDIRKLVKRLHSELEWIPLKAMRKEPDRRYGTASALADDIQNYLDGAPLLAGPESATYRLKKTISRHKALVTGVAVVLVVLIAGIIVTEKEKKKAELATKVASVARRQAQSAYVDQLVESGFLAHEQANPAEAALWFSSAAMESESKLGDPERTQVNRLRAYAWLQQAPLPISAFQVETEPYRLWLSGNGNLLLIEDRRRRFTLWDVNQGRQIELPLTEVTAAAFSPNGLILGIGNTKGQVQLLRLPDFSDLHTFDLKEPISALSFDRSGNMVAFGGTPIRVWNRETSQFLEGDLNLNSRVAYLVFDQNSDHLVAVDVNDNVVLLKLTKSNMDIDKTFPHVKHIVNPNGLGISPCPPLITPTNQLVVRYPLNVLESYQLDGGDITWKLRLDKTIVSMSISSDGRWMTLGDERHLGLWKYGESEATHVHSGNMHFASATAFNSTDSLLAHGGYNNEVQVWGLDREVHRMFRIQHQATIIDLAFVSQKPELLVTAQQDGLIRVWWLPRESPDRRIVAGVSEHAVVSSWNGRYVMPGGNYFRKRLLRTTQVYEIGSGNPSGPPLSPGGLLNGCTFAPDGLHAVTLSTLPAHADRTDYNDFNWERVPGIVTFWNWRTGEKEGEPLQTPSEPVGAEFMPDGKRLVVVCAAGQILVIHSETHEVLQTMDHRAHAEPQWSVPKRWLAVSPDNSTFASVGLGNWTGRYMVRVWNSDSGQELYAVKHDSWIHDASFSNDGKWLGTASADTTVRIWDASSGEETAKLKHPSWVYALQFDKGSQKVLTACLDDSARLWDWPNGRIQQEYTHDDAVANAKFAMNESVVCTVCQDGTLSFWSRSTGRLIVPPRKLSSRSYNTCAEYLEVGADGKYVVANGSSIYFEVFQIPDAASIQENILTGVQLQRLAQLYTGYRIEGTATAKMTSQTWLEEWNSLKSDDVLAKFIRTPDAIQSNRKKDKDTSQVEYERGVSLLREGRFIDAIISFSRALEENPELQNAYYYRAQCFMGIQYNHMAVADLSAAIRYGEITGRLYSLRAQCYLRISQPKEALRDVLGWRHLNPPSSQNQKRLYAHRLLFCASRVGDRGDLAGAISALNIAATDLEQVIEKDDPNDAKDYYDLACVYSLLAEYESRVRAPEHRVSELSNLAVAALQKSVERGYSYAVHAHGDRDLWFVRPTPDFKRIFGSIEKQLIAHYTFDKVRGNRVFDSSSHGIGRLQGDAQIVEDPFRRKVLKLDGDGDYVETGNTADLSTWTISVWVTSPASPSSSNRSGPIQRESNYQINWNHIYPDFRGAAALEVGDTWHAASFGELRGDQWYHLAATYDGTVLKAYKNGTLVDSNSDPSGDPIAEMSSLKLGRHSQDPQYFCGTIDDVRIYDYALSESEIKTLYDDRPVIARYVYAGGVFVQHAGSNPILWIETNSNSSEEYQFVESRRDDMWIYLYDAGRDFTIRIPIKGGRSSFSTNGGESWLPLYNVAEQKNE